MTPESPFSPSAPRAIARHGLSGQQATRRIGRTADTRPHILYLSYNGVTAGVGCSQIVPYLERLSGEFRFTLITMEQTADPAERARMRKRLEDAGVQWHPLRYHAGKSLAIKLWDAAQLGLKALWSMGCDRVQLIHARSYLPAAIACSLEGLVRIPVIFDMRGRLIDEYVEEGYWAPKSRRVDRMRRLERWCLARAAGLVVLTEEARRQLISEEVVRSDRMMAVIPCSVETARFASPPSQGPSWIQELRRSGRLVLAYVGSPILGEQPREMLRFFKSLKTRRPDACLLILTAQQDTFRAHLQEERIAPEDVRLFTVPHEAMPACLQAAHAAVNFVAPTPAKRASSSIKKAECLAAGLPLVLSSGAEDHDALLGAERVGVLVNAFERFEYERSAEALLRLLDEGEPMRARCRAVAKSWYDLDTVGVPRYADLYQKVLSGPAARCGTRPVAAASSSCVPAALCAEPGGH